MRDRDCWTRKVGRNRERDKAARTALRKLGWRVLVLWECELEDSRRVGAGVKSFPGDR